MSHFDHQRSYARAQREYDAQMPPDDGGTDTCPDCDGDKVTNNSNCCGAGFAAPGWPDNDICSKCGGHAEPEPCERCGGTGDINIADERAKAKVAAEEDRADRMRDEAYDARAGSNIDRFLDRHPTAEFRENE